MNNTIHTYNDLPAYFLNDLEDLNQRHAPDAPVAVVLISEVDYNDAHYDPANYALITQIAKTHRVIFSLSSNIGSIPAALKMASASPDAPKPSLLFTNGHYRGDKIRVGQELLPVSRAKELVKQIEPMMAENSTWVIKSCNVANSFAPQVAKEMRSTLYASHAKTSSIGTFFKDGQIHFFDNDWRETGVKFTGDLSQPSDNSLCPESWLEERLDYLDRVEQLNPAPEEINKILKDRYRIGRYYYQQKQYDKAIPLIKPYAMGIILSTKESEERCEARKILGDIFYERGDIGTASFWYADAIPEDDFFIIEYKTASLPRNPDLFYQISNLLIAEGKERRGREWNYLAGELEHFEALKKICAEVDLNAPNRKFSNLGYSKWFSLLLLNKSAPPDLDLPDITDPDLQMAIAKRLQQANPAKAALWSERALRNGYSPDLDMLG